MKISIGECEISCDNSNWTVRKFGTKINPKTKEETYGLKWERYPSSLYQACKLVLFEGYVKDSDTDNINALIDCIRQSTKEIKDAVLKAGGK